MEFSYKPLWKLMIDKDIKNCELMKKANISRSTFYKLKNNENVTTEVLLRICNVLHCDISEVIECVEVNNGEK
ncbi:helix-turn-helix transcriptional regulator [Clostridium perfringens]|uniref:helix-turn-helix domain-containing protein n=1 Tax=Clostridium perfringens TaxID=1502 RepID=UPI001ABBD54C|nr:helix-turn-helix transcriptional regulator [Clostridium perfringens]MBO3360784.1 helix-turn-helix transcriptional regulator [Clostridium perfringens]MDK0843100.1 helix-turn-helix transcriptional regulator [Clostridium perfringens]